MLDRVTGRAQAFAQDMGVIVPLSGCATICSSSPTNIVFLLKGNPIAQAN